MGPTDSLKVGTDGPAEAESVGRIFSRPKWYNRVKSSF